MDDNSKTEKPYDESYFMFKKIISEIFIIPLLLYILSISFITHVSIFNQPLKSQINLNTDKKRKILFLIMIFLYICQIISVIKITNMETSANTVSSTRTLIILLFHTMSIMAALLTIYFIEEKNKKQIKLDKKNILQWFIILNLIYYLLDLVNEIVYGYFTILTPLTFFFCVYFQIFFYKYPNDSYKIFLSKGFKYIELNEFDKELINKKLQSIKVNEEKFKDSNNRYYIPMTYLNTKMNMLGNDNENINNISDRMTNNNLDLYNNESYNSNKINKLIDELYNPNKNNNYLENSYEGVLKIVVTFQSNFSIDYGTYYNYNKTKTNLMDKEQNMGSVINRLSLINSINFRDENDESNEHLDVANFYTSIIFSFNVSATSSFYVTNKHLTKSLEEFFKLDIVLENEFNEERYNLSLVKQLPRLNIKKCFDDIKKGGKINNFSNNNDILLKCVQNTKNICEKYLKDITANPHFIIPEVLFFLEIRDKNVFQLYININDKIRKKDNNIITRFSRRTENTLSNNFYLSTNCNYFTSHNDYNMKVFVKIIKGDYFNINLIIKTKNNDKEYNDYYLLLRLTYGESNKFVKKKLDETIFVLNEFNKLLDYNFNNDINYSEKKNSNKGKDNNSKIYNLFSEFVDLYNKINGSFSTPSQSFRLSKNCNNSNILVKYPDYSNKENNLFNNLIINIESLLNLIINYYIDEIPNSNQVIHEYFIDCIDDYWNVFKLKKYIKHDNNLLSLFQNVINEKTINDIFVLDKNYLFININYKVIVFYEICFKISTSTNFIQLDKKYEFEEVKNYIDLMNVELSLGMVWPEKCFLVKEEMIDELYNIHIIRLNYITKYLNKIFNSNILYNSKNWKKIFYGDKSYHDIIEIKLKELKHNHNKNNNNNNNKEFIIRKHSDEEASFYLNNEEEIKLENNISNANSFKNNDSNAKNENNKIYDDIVKNNNNYIIINSEESQQSSDTLTSNFSQNSKAKNLFDI